MITSHFESVGASFTKLTFAFKVTDTTVGTPFHKCKHGCYEEVTAPLN